MSRDETRALLVNLRDRLLDDDVTAAANAAGKRGELDLGIDDLDEAIEEIQIAALADIEQRLAAHDADMRASTAALKHDLQSIQNIAKIIDDIAKVVEVVAKILSTV